VQSREDLRKRNPEVFEEEEGKERERRREKSF